jgi:hypothetical protein
VGISFTQVLDKWSTIPLLEMSKAEKFLLAQFEIARWKMIVKRLCRVPL